MSDGARFVDSRFHVSVRPLAEYAIPDAGAVVVAALLGDTTATEARASLERLLPRSRTSSPSPPEDDENDSDDAYPQLRAIRQQCMTVCAQAHDYVRDISEAWVAHVRDTRARVLDSTRRLRRDAAEAARVRHAYRGHGRAVEREFRNELTRIHTALEDELRTHRAHPPPVVARPESLRTATEELRAQFTEAYGVVPTPTLLRVRKQIERELDLLQRPVLEHAVRHMALALRA